VTTHRFRAMGTSIEVQGPTGDPHLPRAFERIVARFEREEERFSRFRATSELSRVNASSGRPTRVTSAFAEVLGLALDGAALTGSRFDPTVHDALVAAGYDRTFDEVLAGARGRLHPAVPCGRWKEISIHDDVVEVPRGVHLDLGGIAKGWTADRAAEGGVEAGAAWILVNAGGDLRIGGDAPSIAVSVEDPEDPRRELISLELSHGALATSSVVKRSWGDGEHHVIDPRTGLPSQSEVLQATVWAETCAVAEVLATASILRGRSAADLHQCILVLRNDEAVISMPVEARV